jgi:hypothetical protein
MTSTGYVDSTDAIVLVHKSGTARGASGPDGLEPRHSTASSFAPSAEPSSATGAGSSIGSRLMARKLPRDRRAFVGERASDGNPTRVPLPWERPTERVWPASTPSENRAMFASPRVEAEGTDTRDLRVSNEQSTKIALQQPGTIPEGRSPDHP